MGGAESATGVVLEPWAVVGRAVSLLPQAATRTSTQGLTPRRYRVMFRGMGPSASELRTIPLFHGFADDELSEVADLFKPVEADRQVLFDVNEPATSFYLLTK